MEIKLVGNKEERSYIVEEHAQEGGCAVVYRGRWNGGGAWKAVKIGKTLESIAAIVANAEVQALECLEELHSPGIMALEFSGYYAPPGTLPGFGFPSLVSPYIEGQNILEYGLGKSLVERVRLVEKVARIMHRVHNCHSDPRVRKELKRRGLHLDTRIVHRDLTPNNILVDTGGDPCILDFGIARFSSPNQSQRTMTVVGTLEYMAPEQASGGKPHPGMDIWALAMILYRLVEEGELRRYVDLAGKQQMTEREWGRVIAGGFRGKNWDGGLSAICRKALQWQAGQRYAEAKHLADALEQWRHGRYRQELAKIYRVLRPQWKWWPVSAPADLAAKIVEALAEGVSRKGEERELMELVRRAWGWEVCREELRRIVAGIFRRGQSGAVVVQYVSGEEWSRVRLHLDKWRQLGGVMAELVGAEVIVGRGEAIEEACLVYRRPEGERLDRYLGKAIGDSQQRGSLSERQLLDLAQAWCAVWWQLREAEIAAPLPGAGDIYWQEGKVTIVARIWKSQSATERGEALAMFKQLLADAAGGESGVPGHWKRAWRDAKDVAALAEGIARASRAMDEQEEKFERGRAELAAGKRVGTELIAAAEKALGEADGCVRVKQVARQLLAQWEISEANAVESERAIVPVAAQRLAGGGQEGDGERESVAEPETGSEGIKQRGRVGKKADEQRQEEHKPQVVEFPGDMSNPLAEIRRYVSIPNVRSSDCFVVEEEHHERIAKRQIIRVKQRGRIIDGVLAAKAEIVVSQGPKKEARSVAKRSSDGRYEVSPEGVITDSTTGLEWYVGPDCDITRDEADAWVKNLTVAGGGWRVPTTAELKGIYEENKGSEYAYIDKVFWDKNTYLWVWANDINGFWPAWDFSLPDGGWDWYVRSSPYGVRGFAVRSGSR